MFKVNLVHEGGCHFSGRLVIPVGPSLKSDSTKATNTCCDLKVLASKDHLNGTLNSEVH